MTRIEIAPQVLREALSAWCHTEYPALPGRTNHIRAGVLVPVQWTPDPHAVLTLRTRAIRHGGEVSFPGGTAEDGDADLAATARREAWEELGIGNLEFLGRLSSMPVYTSDHRLEPFVARIDGVGTVSVDEVARVIRVSLTELLALPWIDGLPFEHEGDTHVSPVFVADELAVFGATALTLWELLQAIAAHTGCGLPPLRTGRFDWSDLVRWRAAAPTHRPPLER